MKLTDADLDRLEALWGDLGETLVDLVETEELVLCQAVDPRLGLW